MDNLYYTYAWLRKDGTPYYIGKGKGVRAYLKSRQFYPGNDRVLILKKNLTEAEAFRHEEYLIFVLGRKDLNTGILRNRTNGGEGSSGTVCSEAAKEKHRQAAIGNKYTLGHKLSEEHKKKISETLKIRSQCKEVRRKMSEKLKGKPKSEEHRNKLSEARKGKLLLEKTKLKISESITGRKWWVNQAGETRFSHECPGNDWTPGRAKKGKTP